MLPRSVPATTDPEVIVAEFEYQGTVAETEEPFVLPGIFVLRVRDGEIISSRDYFDHVTAARVRGQLDALVAAVQASSAPSAQSVDRFRSSLEAAEPDDRAG